MEAQYGRFLKEDQQERQQMNRLTLGRQVKVRCRQLELNGRYGHYQLTGPANWPLSDSVQTADGHTLTRVREGVYVTSKMLYPTEIIRNRKTANVLRSRYQYTINCFKDGRVNDILYQAMSQDYEIQPQFEMITEEDTLGELSDGLSLVAGKPGAGKTRQVTRLVDKETAGGKRILIISPTHSLINSFAERIKSPKVLLNPEYRIDEKHQKWHVAKLADFNGKRKSVVPLESPNCIISTVNHAISNLNELNIHTIIMDEATKIGLLEGLAAVMEARNVKRILLIGDPMQLGTYDSNGRAQENILEWAIKLKNVWKKEMRYTYRFGAPLSTIISENIYQGKLVSKAKPTTMKWYIIDCDMKKCKNIGCKAEAKAAIDAYKKQTNCQIITPYKKQLTLIKEIKKEAEIINSDLSQGKEYDNVVVSMGRHQGEGFLTINRLNVTLTRAKRSLTIVVNRSLLDDHTLLKNMYQQSQQY